MYRHWEFGEKNQCCKPKGACCRMGNKVLEEITTTHTSIIGVWKEDGQVWWWILLIPGFRGQEKSISLWGWGKLVYTYWVPEQQNYLVKRCWVKDKQIKAEEEGGEGGGEEGNVPKCLCGRGWDEQRWEEWKQQSRVGSSRGL